MKKKEKIYIACLIGIIVILLIAILIISSPNKKMEKIQTKDTITNASIMNTIIEPKEEYENPGTPREISKVRIEFKEGTLTRNGATLVIYDDNTYHFAYQESFTLEKRENNEWKAVPYREGMEFRKVGVCPMEYTLEN